MRTCQEDEEIAITPKYGRHIIYDHLPTLKHAVNKSAPNVSEKKIDIEEHELQH